MTSGRNRITKVFLGKWSYFDRSIGVLEESEKIKMKIFYSALKEIDPEERGFLAEKYRIPHKTATYKSFLPDDVLAAKQGLSLKEYKEKRIDIETKLHQFVVKYYEMYNEELSKAFDIEFGRTRTQELKIVTSDKLDKIFSLFTS